MAIPGRFSLGPKDARGAFRPMRGGGFGAFLLLATLATGASGCSTMGYLFQAGKGQLSLLNRAKPIDEVLKNERVQPRIKRLLAEVPAIKKYGEENGVKPTHNYTEYVQLDRPAAVYVVSACEPLKFVSKEWNFPVVGRFPYLGWFDLDGAKGLAAELKKEGLDVDLRGARAFSTLGWFRDPIVSSMIPEGDEALGELVNVVIHESVHATIYVNGQAFFNESIASFVADRLTMTYLKKTRGENAPEVKAYLDNEAYGKEYERKLYAAYQKLAELYSSPKPDPQKLEEKTAVLKTLQEELKAKREINNATLVQFKTYNTGSPDFGQVLDACGGSWGKFLGTLLRLEPKDFSKPQQDDLAPVLKKVAGEGCVQKS